MIGDALMDSLGGALGGSTGAGTLPPPRAKVSRGGGAPSAGGFGAVVGVDRGAGAQALTDAGATLVVADLEELA